MRVRNLLSWLVFVIFLAGLLVGFSNLQAISDWWQLRGYQPGSRVIRLADETTMKDTTRRVFYINHPELDSKPEFNGHCRTAAEQTIVLGCFINREGIYLLNVSDSRLNGVVEVTAAHEALHAMYERLNDSERTKVDEMTARFYAGLKNERIKKTIDGYRKKDPSVVPNELHSILGTEVSNLSPELENYYKKYFDNRSKIVDYSDRYEHVFTDIETKAKDYESRLNGLKSTIVANEAQINAKNAELNTKQGELDSLLAEKNTNEYNQQVPVYNAMVKDYNAMVNTTRGQIDEYNLLLDERNALVIQQQELYQAMDSNSFNRKNSK